MLHTKTRGGALGSALLVLLAVTGAEAGQSSVAPRAVTEADAIRTFGLRERLQQYGARPQQPAGAGRIVEVIDGDLHVTGDLLVDAPRARAEVEALVPRRPGDRPATTLPNAIGLIVTGRLTVDGAVINANLNGGPFLVVLGETHARAMFAGGAEFRFDRLASFDDAVVGCYNDGRVDFAGGVKAPMVISEDHDFAITGKGTPYVDYFNGDGDLEALQARLHPEIELDDVEELDAEAMLLPRIRRGQPVLKPQR